MNIHPFTLSQRLYYNVPHLPSSLFNLDSDVEVSYENKS